MEELKERLLAVLQNLFDKIQETESFQKLKESFEALSTSTQQLVVGLVAVAILLICLSFPYGYYSESSDHVSEFENRRSLIRELLLVARESQDTPQIPIPPSIESAKDDIEAKLKAANILTEQIKSVQLTGSQSTSIPGNLSNGALEANLAKLNLKQVVDLGYYIQSLSPSIKMTELLISANREDARYLDVTYKLTSLKVPDLTLPPPIMDEPPSKAKKIKSGGEEE